jgi:hypothetical protein
MTTTATPHATPNAKNEHDGLHFPHLSGRLEDRRLLTGRGTYTSDRNLPGQVHAVFLRADRAHARILAIDTAAALAMPGVLRVLTGEDIKAAGINSLPTQLPSNGRDGQPLLKPYRPALALGKVRFVGEPVVCLIAQTLRQAQDAVEAVQVDYEDLPVVARTADAMASGAVQLHDNVPGNRVFDYGAGDEAATDTVIKSAKKVVRLSLYNNRVVGSPMEPRAAIGSYDAARDQFTFYTVTQGVNLIRAQLSVVLGVGEEKIDIVAKDVGGGFGVRSNIQPEYPVLLLAAKMLGRVGAQIRKRHMNRPRWAGDRSIVSRVGGGSFSAHTNSVTARLFERLVPAFRRAKSRFGERQRIENLLLHEVFPADARRLLRHRGRDRIADVRVDIFLPRRVGRLLGNHGPHGISTRRGAFGTERGVLPSDIRWKVRRRASHVGQQELERH